MSEPTHEQRIAALEEAIDKLAYQIEELRKGTRRDLAKIREEIAKPSEDA
jgi:hypothetical protein